MNTKTKTLDAILKNLKSIFHTVGEGMNDALLKTHGQNPANTSKFPANTLY